MMLSPVSRPKSFKSKKRPGVGEAWCLPPPAGTTKPLAAVISISSALELSTNYKASPDHETELLALTIVHEATRVGLWGCGFRIRRRFAAMDFNQNMQLADLGERICILGPSNSGKSTLAETIARKRGLELIHL